jgi:hypothetical protein
MRRLDIPLVHGLVPFHKALYELVKQVCFREIPEGGCRLLELRVHDPKHRHRICCLLPTMCPPYTGILKKQLDTLVLRNFRHLYGGNRLQLADAKACMRAARHWRARARAKKQQSTTLRRTERDHAPSYMDVLSQQDHVASVAFDLLQASCAVYTYLPTCSLI